MESVEDAVVDLSAHRERSRCGQAERAKRQRDPNGRDRPRARSPKAIEREPEMGAPRWCLGSGWLAILAGVR